jgi:hypothetical protein
VVAIVAAFIVIVGGGTAFFVYDRATAIDRSTPEVVVVQFLRATLVERDVRRIGLFVCNEWPAEQALAAAKPPTNPDISVSWGDLASTTRNGSSTVHAVVTFSAAVGGVFQQDPQSWTFTLKDQSGWRVCGLTKG